jgi:hypothetical protein
MDQEGNSGTIGTQIGNEAMEHGERQAAEYCAHERQRIETANQPIILALRAKMARLQDKDRDLEARISKALPPGEAAARKRSALLLGHRHRAPASRPTFRRPSKGRRNEPSGSSLPQGGYGRRRFPS